MPESVEGVIQQVKGINVLRVEPGGDPFVGDWEAPGVPPGAQRLQTSSFREPLDADSFRRLIGKEYIGNTLFVGPGVENLRVDRGAVLLLLPVAERGLGVVIQYRTREGDKVLRVAHHDTSREEYNGDHFIGFMNSVLPDRPTEINFGLYGDFSVLFTKNEKYMTIFSQVIEGLGPLEINLKPWGQGEEREIVRLVYASAGEFEVYTDLFNVNKVQGLMELFG